MPLLQEAGRTIKQHNAISSTLLQAMHAGRVSLSEQEKVLEEAEEFGFTVEKDRELLRVQPRATRRLSAR